MLGAPLRLALLACGALVTLGGAQSASSSTSARPTPAQNSTLAPSANTTASATSSLVPQASALAGNSTATPPSTGNSTAGPVLHTHVDAAFGVLGGLLIVSGIPLGFWGGKNRWSSFFLVGTYIGTMVISLIILKVGVVGSVNDPSSTMRGLFLFASLAGGLFCGAACIFWWKLASHITPAMAGFALGLFLQSVRDNGLIRPVGLRYILFIVPAAMGFVLSTIESLNPLCTLVSTAILGSMALVIGVDCFSTAGLKEFYVWNLGLSALFPQLNGHFNLSLGMQIELGVTGALALCMGAWQARVYDLIVAKKRELKDADRARALNEEEAGRRSHALAGADLEDWEEKYGRGGRSPSSVAALLGSGPPSSFDLSRSQTLERSRTTSGEFLPPINFNRDTASPTTAATPPLAHSRLSGSGVDWESYLSARKVITPTNGPPRRSSALSTVSRKLALDTIVSEDGHGDRSYEDDATPLSQLRQKSLASPTLRTSPPSPPRPRPTSLAFPSSESTPRLSRPHSAAFPSSTSLARPGLGFEPSRRNTMVDLSKETSRGTYEHPSRLERRSTGERLILPEYAAPKPTAPLPAAKVMGMEELQDKHRRRISQMQAPVLQSVRTEAEVATAKAAYELRRQREAAEMRDKERSNQRASRRHSIGSLSVLLDKFGNSGASPASPTSPTSPISGQRRSQSFNQGMPSVTAGAFDEPRARPPLANRRESQRLSGLAKVAAWQEAPHDSPPTSSSGSGSTPPSGVTPQATGPAQKPKKKHDWLGY